MIVNPPFPEALQSTSDEEVFPDPRVAPFIPVPQINQFPASARSSRLPLVCDRRAMVALLEMLKSRSGLSINEIARRMGCSKANVAQYLHGRRSNPNILWFVKYAEICGSVVVVEVK